MAKENIENNNSVGKDSSNPPADLSYKSENIVGSKSRTKRDAEFAETKLSPSEKLSQNTKTLADKIKSTDTKKVNKGLIIFIAIIAIACIVGIIFLIVSNNDFSEEGETDETGLIEENEGKDEIAAARAEAEAALKNNPNDCTGAAKGYVDRINASFVGSGEDDGDGGGMAEILINDAEEYFTNVNSSTCSLLAVYKGINYSDLTEEPDVYWYYERILQLADELGDTETRAKYEPLYNALADEVNSNKEDDNDAYEEGYTSDIVIINEASEGGTNESE